MPRKKITVVGAGFVGGTLAQRLVEKEFGDVVLVDIVPDLPQGKALDLNQTGPIYGYDSQVIGTNQYQETQGSDIVVITSGIPRKPGMSRDDLLKVNVEIVKQVVREAAAKSPSAILIVVSNPLDAMTYTAYKVSGFPRERVLGMAGVLDTARFRTFISRELQVSVKSINALMLGGHGDTMVPVLSHTTVGGVPVTRLIPKEKLEAIVKRTQDGGAEIVKLLKTGSAFYAPSAAVVEMVEAILLDKKEILPCSYYCQQEYGLSGLFMGVPVKLGTKGGEQVVELTLNQEETAAFKKSVDSVRELCTMVDKML